MAEHSSKIWYLSQINILKAMSQDEMVQMDKITEMAETPKYSPIYLPGDPANDIYLLKKGRVRISRLSEDGKQITMEILEPGNIFGELALIDEDSSHETIAEAMEDTMLCIVNKADFEIFLTRHPDINLKVTKLIGLRLKKVESRVEDLVFKSAQQRLYELLLRMSKEYPKAFDDGILINFPLTHQEIGELTNIARPTVTELLKRLENQGKIRTLKRKIIVLTPQNKAQV